MAAGLRVRGRARDRAHGGCPDPARGRHGGRRRTDGRRLARRPARVRDRGKLVSDPASPERRKTSILLIVSLCLNLALVGLGATMFLRGPPPREAKGLSPQVLMHIVPAERDKIAA